MADTIPVRSIRIMRFLSVQESVSRGEIERALGESRISTIRELRRLVDQGDVATTGDGPSTAYRLTAQGRTVVLWDTEGYLTQGPDQRHPRYTHIAPDLFSAIQGNIGHVPTFVGIGALRHRQRSGQAEAQRELERFVIELSWKSSKIEGNTYTLLDTERLIRESTEATGHPHDEAVMILNHKRAFEYVWQHHDSFRRPTLPLVEEVHELLVRGLDVPYGLRQSPVGMTGTAYIPPASKAEIASYMHEVLKTINTIDGPAAGLEKALACLVLLPYLQPFADGNKRSSRLVANGVLLAYGFPPLSYRSVDEQAYKGALILFYEQGTLANFRELFLKQLEDSASTYFFPVDGAE